MLEMSKQDLIISAHSKGYRPEILEKVYRLLDLLEQFMSVSYLKERLVLKGGTAINLFCSQGLPRLSVDLDFNYIGSTDRDVMRKEKIQLEDILIDVAQRRRYELHRNPRAHAGGKMIFVYQSFLGNKGRLEVDINYILRVPLWRINWCSSSGWPKPTQTAILDIHELAAGKLHALLGREASRDLFDSHRLLTQWDLDKQKLRLAFTIYAGMERDDWQRLHVDQVKFSVKDIRDKLIPVLKSNETPNNSSHEIKEWANRLVENCKTELLSVLPFQSHEIEFLECLQKHGEIRPDLISNDENFNQRVMQHPSLLWRAKQVLTKKN